MINRSLPLPIRSWFGKDFAPLLLGPAPDLLARFRYRRKILHPFIRTTSVDNSTRTQSFLPLRNNWIERTAPTSADNLDVLFGIRPRSERPQYVIGIGDLNVVVNHDDIAAQVAAGMTVSRDHSGLSR